MPDEIKPFTFDEVAFTNKVTDIQTFQSKFKGKPGYNAYTWLAKNLTPLLVRFENGERTKELFDKVLSLKNEEPIVERDRMYIENPPKEAQAAGASHNMGQTIMGQNTPK